LESFFVPSLRNRFPNLIVIAFLLFLSGCGGCSKSGRQEITSKKNSLKLKAKEEISTLEKNPIPEEKTPTGNSELSVFYQEFSSAIFYVFIENYKGEVGQGTGFFISSNGIGVTNDHVLEGGGEKYIITEDGETFPIIEILEREKNDYLDYAVFRVQANGRTFKSLEIARNRPAIGERILSIGNPGGLGYTLGEGIVSQYREKMIQISIPSTHGASGSPVFNEKNEVVGIITSGVGEADLNFAVDIQYLHLSRFLR
jgi:serine protease Do